MKQIALTLSILFCWTHSLDAYAGPNSDVAIDPAVRWQQNEKLKDGIRSGSTPDNFTYTISSDGSGDLKLVSDPDAPNWHYACPLDAMTDKRTCTITNGYYGIVIGFRGATPSMVCLGAHDFPGKRGMLRIDRDEAMTTDERGCVVWSRVAKLPRARTLTIRYFKFPTDHSEDAEDDLSGLTPAISLTAFVYRNLNKLAF